LSGNRKLCRGEMKSEMLGTWRDTERFWDKGRARRKRELDHGTGRVVNTLCASRKENSAVKACLFHSTCFLLGELGSWPCEQRVCRELPVLSSL